VRMIGARSEMVVGLRAVVDHVSANMLDGSN
jgi:hypothetical protein